MLAIYLSVAYNLTMDKKEIIGQNIKRLRTEKRKSQENLGKVLGISHAAISDIERGRTNLSVEALIKIANFFEVEVQDILGEKQVKRNYPSFSYGRGSYGMDEEESKELRKAQEEFRKLAREKAESE